MMSNPDTDPRLQRAVAWATQQMGASRLWLEDGVTLCDKFVENASGVTAQYPTAYDMYLALGKSGDPARHTLATSNTRRPVQSSFSTECR